jgi:ribulose-5-phosphate 4-epimerase/fuculose-1-phosphate aldolase
MLIPDIAIELLHEFTHWAHLSAAKGLLNCSSGNLSHRFDDKLMLISQSGCWLENMSNDQVSVFDLNTCKSQNNVTPSGEWKLHQAVYKQCPDARVVLHFQSPYATTIACSEGIPNYNAIIEVPVYIGKIAHVPYLMPGSKELADAVAEAAAESTMIQLSNHGQVVLGKSFKDVVEKAVFFEFCCKIIVDSGTNYQPINAGHLSQLMNYRR